MVKIAFLDIDETLVNGQTQKYLAQEAFHQGKIGWVKLVQLLFFFTKYKLGLVSDVREIMEASYALLKDWRVEEANLLIEQCYRQRIKKNIFPDSMKLINDLRTQGYKIFLISNTLQPIVDLLAKYFGADYGVGTELIEVDGKLQGKIGRLMYGQSKVDYIIDWNHGNQDFSKCRAYSDNKSDVPLLKLVGEPTAVNPDAVLRKTAQERSWPIIYLN